MADISTVYESVVTSEEVTLQLQDISISVYESTVLSEDVLSNVAYPISVSSSTGVSDVLTIESDLNVSVYFQAYAWDDPGSGETQQIFLEVVQYFGTDPRPDHYPILPVISKSDIRFRETISITGKVPTVSGEGSFGSFITGKAPTVSSDITMSDEYAGYISVEGKAPIGSCEMVFGSFITGTVPTVSGEITLYTESIRIEGKVPIASGYITIPNNFISIEGYVPVHTAEIIFIVDGTISISGKVPIAYGSISISEEIGISISGIVPVAKIEYGDMLINGNFIVISGKVPIPTSFHPTGDENVSLITMSEDSRFEDLILQYKRWPDEV